ncbi:TPA: XRE family transcriptional regulator [Vibrio vulnificus]|nr:helix-turn-helix transcriptional regulator [Vibrio vulnificus]HAS8137917.1 XRE family transcriptional regulator [Vibrio vulnificus]HAS8218917.1 XRE family transcriptional regulator [Vibrio vulnificus]HAS8299638.1 XRE family transcriptional regulator [Vibrio vulnificus]
MAEKSLLLAFGAKVKSLRLEKKLSQEDLAELCALHRTYIGSVERGQRNVSIVNIVKIASALGTTSSLLLEGVEFTNE